MFYGGELGQRVVDGVQELGGFITLEDLASHKPEWVEPMSVDFRGVRVWELPPSGQGIAALEMLRILEPYDLAAMGHNSAEYRRILHSLSSGRDGVILRLKSMSTLAAISPGLARGLCTMATAESASLHPPTAHSHSALGPLWRHVRL